jgi:hypothetical protein
MELKLKMGNLLQMAAILSFFLEEFFIFYVF